MSHEFDNRKPRTKSTTARTATAQPQRVSRRQNRGNSDAANWGDADSQKVLETIRRISEQHCAIQFGYTRDGGAFSIRIVGDGEPYNEYVRPTEDINLYLDGLCNDFAR